MAILQVGIYPIEYESGQKGVTKVPCVVCGKNNLHRLRVVRLVESGQFIIHVCVNNLCLRSVLGVDAVHARKIRSNGAKIKPCSRCSRDARGGVYATGVYYPWSISPRTGIDGEVWLCEVCLLQRIRDVQETHERIKLNGGID